VESVGKIVETISLFRILVCLALLAALGGAGHAQESPVPFPVGQSTPANQSPQATVALHCIQPQPMLSLQDYKGPLAKTVGILARPLERKAAHPPHYKAGDILCSLEPKQKFILFVRDSYDPTTFLGAAFNAGLEQAENTDPTFGQGTAGYAKRFGTSYVDQASFRFFKDFAYPSLFSEDPRYYRLIHGTVKRRMLHVVEHLFVGYRDNGTRMFNVTEWLGTSSAVVLSNVYHPGNQRGFVPAAEGVGFSFASDVGYDMLREFWPEISRKFKLPFREEPDEGNLNPAPGVK
jgi:hypothetical protein